MTRRIDPHIVEAAQDATADELQWALADGVQPRQAVEALHTHRFAARLEQRGWHGYPENIFDRETPRRNVAGEAWNRVDLYAANAERKCRLWMEVKRMELSTDGAKAGFGAYSFEDFKRDWAWDFRRLTEGPQDLDGWTTWRVFYLALRGPSQPSILTSIVEGADGDGAALRDEQSLDQAILGIPVDGGAQGLVRGLVEVVRAFGVSAQPVLGDPLPYQDNRLWYPLLMGWSTRG